MKKILLIITSLILLSGCVKKEELYICIKETTENDLPMVSTVEITGINNEVLNIKMSAMYQTDSGEMKEELTNLFNDSKILDTDSKITYELVDTNNSITLISNTPINEYSIVYFDNNNIIKDDKIIMDSYLAIFKDSDYICKKETDK